MNKRLLAPVALIGIAFAGGFAWSKLAGDRKNASGVAVAPSTAQDKPVAPEVARLPEPEVVAAPVLAEAAEVAASTFDSPWDRVAWLDAAALTDLLTRTPPQMQSPPPTEGAAVKEEPAAINGPTEPIPPGAVGHVVLLCAGNQITLRGEVPTENSKNRLLEKARKTYPELQLESEVRVTPELAKPEEGLDLTLLSFPTAPKSQTPGMIATAVVGQPWRHVAVPAAGLPAELLPRLGLFPAEFNAARALSDCRQLLPQLKAHLSSLALPKTASRN